jgi:SAM-dependent methyltransferase
LVIVCLIWGVCWIFSPYSTPEVSKPISHYYDALTQLWQNHYARQKSSVHSLLQVPTAARAEAASWGEVMDTFDSNMVDYLIWTSIKDRLPARAPKILDAGSGLGGTLFYLQRRIGQGTFEGLTLSRLQADEATVRVPSPSIADFKFRVADFTDPLPPGEYDVIVCVESLFHAKDLVRVIVNLKQALRPGGLLVIVDDMSPCSHHSHAVEPSTRSLVNGTEDCTNFDHERDLHLFERNWHGIVLDPLALERSLRPFTLLRAENLALGYPMPRRNRLLLSCLLYILSLIEGLLPDSWFRLIANAHLGGFAREQAYLNGKLLYGMLVAQAPQPEVHG